MYLCADTPLPFAEGWRCLTKGDDCLCSRCDQCCLQLLHPPADLLFALHRIISRLKSARRQVLSWTLVA